MYLVKIMKRKDAASVAVAVVLAYIFTMWAPPIVGRLAGMLSGIDNGQYYSYSVAGADWQVAYLQPTFMAVLQIILLEVVLRVVVAFRNVFVRRSK